MTGAVFIIGAVFSENQRKTGLIPFAIDTINIVTAPFQTPLVKGV